MSSQINNQVIVSCAGSGKTYKLINRLMDLLEAGASPGEILIITFTKKAAAEIRERLLKKLTEKTNDADNSKKFFWKQLRRRILLTATPEDVLHVHTFHSWFLSLLENRPWDDIGGTPSLADDDILFEESWRRWQYRAEQKPTADLKQVLAELSPHSLRELCKEFKENRNVWELCEKRGENHYDESLYEKAIDEAREKLQQAAQAFLQKSGDGSDFKKAVVAAQRLVNEESTAANEQIAFFTTTGSPRKNLYKNADKHGYTFELDELSEKLIAMIQAEEDKEAAKFCAAALSVCEDFDKEWRAVCLENHKITFNDMELNVWQMLQNSEIYSALSHRLYMRYNHILIDEFQDTSPLQWQIVRSWLVDSHGNDNQPSVFIVGDAKQAIYRFRHGDSRLLGCAEIFLQEYYEAKQQPQENTCRRCGDNILKVVNAAFEEGEFLADFMSHQCGETNANLPSRVEYHPYSRTSRAGRSSSEVLRNPLLQARDSSENAQEKRAAAVADKVAEILQHWHIRDKQDDQDEDKTRLVCAADILILVPNSTHMAEQIDALSAKGVECAIVGGRGVKFLESFECADILDLIAVLLSTGRDYSLARVLKSPIFSMDDETLTDIVGTDYDSKKSLWEKLQNHSSPQSRRARVLLKLWRRRSENTVLPAHDFLSWLFAKGNIIARYRAAVSGALKERVGENLSRLLDLSLLIEGGARPLLSQFLEDARRGRSEMEATLSAVGGVRLMTIHAAKGLQAPIVILADADFAEKRHSNVGILIDWQPQDKIPSQFIIALRRHKYAYASLREELQGLTEREKANQLYVAMTRAEQALIVFSPASSEGVTELPLTAMLKLSAKSLEKEKPSSTKINHEVNDEALEKTNDLSTKTKKTDAEEILVFGDDLCKQSTTQTKKEQPVAPASSITPMGERNVRTTGMVRGEMRHQIIALLLTGVDANRARQLVAAEDNVWQQAEKMANSEALQKLLHNSREILIERDFVVDDKTIRPDLVVIGEQVAWVVDYKTGRADVASHRPQLESYREAVSLQYPAYKIYINVLDIHGQLHDLDR
ncbi:MAG: UvrD-helicase domain-containing protein [Gammaproteobacteria bacterium WSBS_2016_MAG_OTU1]